VRRIFSLLLRYLQRVKDHGAHLDFRFANTEKIERMVARRDIKSDYAFYQE
jgi:hypothetical protein